MLRFGDQAAGILRALPRTGPLFPYLRRVRASDRATEFKQRCAPLGIQGVTLHSYRYAWAERAKQSGYPERFAQEALGQNSKAVSFFRVAGGCVPRHKALDRLRNRRDARPEAKERPTP